MDKYSHSRVYGLSFLFPNRRAGRTHPEIVLTTLRTHAEFVAQLLKEREALFAASAKKYMQESLESLWPDEQSDLFTSERSFGVNESAYLTEEDDEVEYHFPLIPSNDCALAFTLHLLLHALDCLPHNELGEGGNKRQLMTIHTRVDNHATAGYGHMMGGHIYPDMRRWLARLGSAGDTDPLKTVRLAMSSVAQSLDPEHTELFADNCRANVNSEGRFILECAGNACDVAIYPDLDRGPNSDEPSQFACHNLDWARQQLTLLAGLAALHDMAANELG